MSDAEAIAAELLGNELALLDPATRRNRERLLELLAEDFEEFGASGQYWRRDEIVAELAIQDYTPPALEDFRCSLLAPGVALVTYRTVRTNPETAARNAANRSSIWIEENGRWRVRFHQGTPAKIAGEAGAA